MEKIFNSLSRLIMEAMKEKNSTKANALKNLKAKMLEFKTAKNAKPLDDAAETGIIKKMVTELHNDSDLFNKNSRNDLAESAMKESEYLEEFLPKEATIEEIKAAVEQNIEPGMTMKDMGRMIKLVKSMFDNVDGKLVADTVKEYLNQQ